MPRAGIHQCGLVSNLGLWVGQILTTGVECEYIALLEGFCVLLPIFAKNEANQDFCTLKHVSQAFPGQVGYIPCVGDPGCVKLLAVCVVIRGLLYKCVLGVRVIFSVTLRDVGSINFMINL